MIPTNIVTTEKLQDFNPMELFFVNIIFPYKLRKAGVLFEYTELEVIAIKTLLLEDLVAMLPKTANYGMVNIVYNSILNYSENNYIINIGRKNKQNFFMELLELYQSVPFYLQTGFLDIARYGYKLDNGFSLVLK